MTKKCSKCGEEKKLDDFYIQKSGKDGRNPWCKKCDSIRKKEQWKNRSKEDKKRISRRCTLNVYGLTEEDYLELLKKQHHKCAICGKDETEVQKQLLYVDHNHNTGKVRGLLCHHCNTGLGHMFDNKQNLLNAVSYLMENK